MKLVNGLSGELLLRPRVNKGGGGNQLSMFPIEKNHVVTFKRKNVLNIKRKTESQVKEILRGDSQRGAAHWLYCRPF
uniref:Uncharacterized protein n=1 Tax=Nelumbo nucifera TaxID=4432 RepID=A0A822ZK72_NELNU|nr:TPA_asm: hypothetical protein HUJ06_003782 [Nelumbo nucifera]